MLPKGCVRGCKAFVRQLSYKTYVLPYKVLPFPYKTWSLPLDNTAAASLQARRKDRQIRENSGKNIHNIH